MNVTRLYPSVRVDAAPVSAIGSAGGVLLTETLAVSGLASALSAGLEPWRKPLARGFVRRNVIAAGSRGKLPLTPRLS